MTYAEQKPELLVIAKRGNGIETLHYGWICVLNKDKKIIYKKGDINNKIFLRSCTKPIQAIPLVENEIKINDKELAVICGSHSASSKHLELLKNILRKNKLQISDLKCGIHPPIDEEEKIRLIKSNKQSNQLHNNCSGKHLGMLVVSKKKKWDLSSYANLNHPIQKLILNKIKKLSKTKNTTTAIDGCGVPTFSLPVINIAIMFSNFSCENKYSKIISAMAKHPFFVGGDGQIDTEIIKSTKGRVIAKVGAEGIIVVMNNGNCIVIKIADGNSKIRSFVVVKLLVQLGWLKQSEINKNLFLKRLTKGEVKNHKGLTVGKLIFTS